MSALTLKAIRSIERLVDDHFDKISMEFLGIIPKMTQQKRIIFSTAQNSLVSLYSEALGNTNPNKNEENILKVMLRISNGYIDSLRDRTKSNIIEKINGYILDQEAKKETISLNKAKEMFRDEMEKAKKHFKLIANTESNKVTNTGTALQIAKIGKANNEEDPTVFFIVTIDDVTGSEEFVLHLLPDKKTPRVWKLSEISHEYHKKGDPTPSLAGLHPMCRCKISYLANGYGFNEEGKVVWKSENWNELQYQREKYGKPR